MHVPHIMAGRQAMQALLSTESTFHACPVHMQIDELAQVGLHFLDQQRQQFLRTLER
jgi:hypothetical protein